MNVTRLFNRPAAPLAALLTLFLLQMAAPARAAVIGEIKTAVILVNFTDTPAPPTTRTELHTLVFGQVSDFYWENSYQKAFLSGDTFGWLTIPLASTDCNWDSVAAEGNRAALAAGANLATYTHFIYLYPNASGCVGGGGGTVGPSGEKRVFINGESGFTMWMIAHEMGHGFGVGHSDGLDCDVSPLGNACTEIGYGDYADVMGGAGHFNAFQKERLGWLGVAGAPPITTVTTNGRYSIDRYESNGTGSKALKIPKEIDPATGQKTWYYVEYRQPIGFDAVLQGAGNLTSGIQIRTGTLGSYRTASLLLDMTPNSSNLVRRDFADGALDVGRSFIDAASGVTITLAAADASGATIDVTTGSSSSPPSCTRAAPEMILSGPASATAVGSTLTYALSLSNKDSATCAATTFNLARSIPVGWAGTLAATSLSLSAGASASTTLSVTSASTTAAGVYGLGVGAGSSAGAVHTANASASYAVAGTDGTLTESVGTDKATYLRGQTVYMSALVRRNGVVVSGASVKFNVTLPGGGVIMLTATSGSDGYARSTYKLGKSKAAIGSYPLRGDASSGGNTVTATTNFSVN